MATKTVKLPEFDLELSGGGRLTNADLLGRRSILYFYPKDDTPGCTLEGQDFSRLLSEFQRREVAVYGVSPDSAKSHDKFAAKCNLSVPLIADPDKVLCGHLGVWGEKSMYGRTYMGVERSTFLIDEKGQVAREWRSVKATGHAQAVLDALDG